jgi:hypothetical protein
MTELVTSERDKYPTVTEVLSIFGKWDEIDRNILQNAAWRGQRIHDAIAQYLETWQQRKKPTMDIEGIREDIQIKPYLDYITPWLGDAILKVLAVESRLYDDELRLSGQCDAIIETADHTIILIDWKSTAYVQPTWKLQLAAYWHLVHCATDFRPHLAYVVQILARKPGIKTITIGCEEGKMLWDKYKHLLDLHHYLVANGYKQKPLPIDLFL